MVTNKNRIQGYISDIAYQYLEKFKLDNELASTSLALEKILEGLAIGSDEILQPVTSKLKSELLSELHSKTEALIDDKTSRLQQEIEKLEKKLNELLGSLSNELLGKSNSSLSSKLPGKSDSSLLSDLPSELLSESNSSLSSKLPSKSDGSLSGNLPDKVDEEGSVWFNLRKAYKIAQEKGYAGTEENFHKLSRNSKFKKYGLLYFPGHKPNQYKYPERLPAQSESV